LTDQSAP
jgi:divalent metal cation (Fe/Co/Zn/Cd) transporter